LEDIIFHVAPLERIRHAIPPPPLRIIPSMNPLTLLVSNSDKILRALCDLVKKKTRGRLILDLAPPCPQFLTGVPLPSPVKNPRALDFFMRGLSVVDFTFSGLSSSPSPTLSVRLPDRSFPVQIFRIVLVGIFKGLVGTPIFLVLSLEFRDPPHAFSPSRQGLIFRRVPFFLDLLYSCCTLGFPVCAQALRSPRVLSRVLDRKQPFSFLESFPSSSGQRPRRQQPKLRGIPSERRPSLPFLSLAPS